MKPVKKLQIGKKGLTPEFIEHARIIFKKNEVVRISILKSACRDKAQARAMGEKLVRELGKNFTYRLIGYVLVVFKLRKIKVSKT